MGHMQAMAACAPGVRRVDVNVTPHRTQMSLVHFLLHNSRAVNVSSSRFHFELLLLRS